MQHKITFAVPANEWTALKTRILTTNFKADEPSFTKHQAHSGYEFATFASNIYSDTLTVRAMLPASAQII